MDYLTINDITPSNVYDIPSGWLAPDGKFYYVELEGGDTINAIAAYWYDTLNVKTTIRVLELVPSKRQFQDGIKEDTLIYQEGWVKIISYIELYGTNIKPLSDGALLIYRGKKPLTDSQEAYLTKYFTLLKAPQLLEKYVTNFEWKNK